MRLEAHVTLGWTPILAVAEDGARRVLQVTGWTGGFGTAPATGLYVGPTGYETLIADGTDISGTAVDWVFNETLTGTIDGSNAMFSTAFNYVSQSVTVYINGVKGSHGNDYSLVGINQVLFADSPEIGDILEVTYQKL
jgi:hypothetical protein